MAARRTRKPGASVREAERHTDRFTARLPPELAAMIRADAERYDVTLARVLEAYRDLAVESGRLAKVLHAAMVKTEHPADYQRVVRGMAPEQVPVIRGKAKEPSK